MLNYRRVHSHVLWQELNQMNLVVNLWGIAFRDGTPSNCGWFMCCPLFGYCLGWFTKQTVIAHSVGQTALTMFSHYGFDHLEPFCCIGLCHFVDTMLNSCGCGFSIGRPAMLIWSHLAGHFIWSLRVKLIFDPPKCTFQFRISHRTSLGSQSCRYHKCVDLDPALGIHTRTDVRWLENNRICWTHW